MCISLTNFMLGAELRIAWKGIIYARLVFWADHLIVEGDSALVVG